MKKIVILAILFTCITVSAFSQFRGFTFGESSTIC